MPPTDPDQTTPPAGPDPDRTIGSPGPAADLRTGGRFGRYSIQRTLGEGGMGAVYLAHDTTLDRPVALKIPKLSGNVEVAAARFLREAQAVAGLRHPNICPIYDLGVIEGTHFLAMAFVRGDTLATRVGPGRPMEPQEAARIVSRIALAMQVAHDTGVIHRDLEPVNIMIDDRGEPVVMDFGLARRADSGDRQLTIQGDIMGTLAYMPPEQVAGDVTLMGPASDIYALGVVLYELLTGTPPFRGDMFAVLAQIAKDAPGLPSARRPGLDRRFDSVCLKALAKQPQERWKSMRAFADVLAGLAEAAGEVTRPRPGDGPTIILKVGGTNFAYRPPAILPTVNVGRQKRKPGDSADQGNDFVLRVAGNDALSARISRRHFELNRTPSGWSITDRSKTGVTRNGTLLSRDTAVDLSDGDQLGVAGVVTLEVVFRGLGQEDPVNQKATVEVPAPPGSGGGQVQFEASLGDVVTLS